MLNTSTLRPGLLVGIKTSLLGNVSYIKQDIEREHRVGEKTIAAWETRRTIADADEHDAACKVRSAAGYMIRKLCAATAFGCLCPEDQAEALAEAIREAREMIDKFNANARITRVKLYVIVGRVAPDDVEAVRAIRAELAEVIGDMERGVAALTVDKVREAARKATELSAMLNESSKKKVDEVVTSARAAARAINKAIKAGDQAALVIEDHVMQKMAAGRMAFLDLDNDADMGPLPQPVVAPRSIDLGSAP